MMWPQVVATCLVLPLAALVVSRGFGQVSAQAPGPHHNHHHQLEAKHQQQDQHYHHNQNQKQLAGHNQKNFQRHHQVPELMTIVVSASDNSYVSSSPLIVGDQPDGQQPLSNLQVSSNEIVSPAEHYQLKHLPARPSGETHNYHHHNHHNHHRHHDSDNEINLRHHEPHKNKKGHKRIDIQFEGTIKRQGDAALARSNSAPTDQQLTVDRLYLEIDTTNEAAQGELARKSNRSPSESREQEGTELDSSLAEDHLDYLAADDGGEVNAGYALEAVSTTATTTPRGQATELVPLFDDFDDEADEQSGWSETVSKSAPGIVAQQPLSPANIDSLYDVNRAAIIKTRESIELGAAFINYTLVTQLSACLVECWITDSCDTAVYQESPVDFTKHLPNFLASISSGTSSGHNEKKAHQEERNQMGSSSADDYHLELVAGQVERLEATSGGAAAAGGGIYICYLFQCARADGFKCKFSPHNYYVSSTKKTLARETSGAGLAQPIPELVLGKDIPLSQVQVLAEPEAAALVDSRTRYSRIISSHQHHQQRPMSPIERRLSWPLASIDIGPEETHTRGGLNSAIIAILFGVAATGMLILVVGHKMKSIRSRIAHKGHHRRCIVQDADFLANSLAT